MKKAKLILLMVLMPFLLLSCVNSDINIASNNVPTNTPADHGKKSSEADITINILDNGESALDSYTAGFRKAHPGVKLNFIKKDRSSTDIILDDLLSDNGADIINIEKSQMGQFNFIDGFENLLQPPYNAGTILDKFQAHQLSWTESLDGTKLLALPLTHSPRVSYYREDILAQYGFPTDPEKLAVFMENPDNWLNMARELKKHDKWIIPWNNEPMTIYSYEMGMFDKNINFVRNTPGYAKMLSAIRTIKSDSLASFTNIWDENGHEALKNNRIAMVYLGSWGELNLESWAPNTKGKWRATRLPFGIYAVDGTPALAISKNSKHKELAWELVKTIVEGDQKNFSKLINNKSGFLGGQESQKLYAELRKKIPLAYCTPLDRKLEEFWNTEIQNYCEYTYREKSEDRALIDIEQNIKATYGKDIEILKNSLKK